MFEVLIKNPFFVNIFVVVSSLYILFKAADLLVFGISDYARKLGLSDYLIGLLVVAAAASMPEVVASLMGLEASQSGILFGTIVGSNMVHVALSIGVIAIIGGFMGKNVSVECKILDKALFPIWLMLMLPFLLISKGMLSRLDGFVLLGVFIFYVVLLWHQEGTFGKIKKKVLLEKLWRDVFIFVGCLAALLLAGRWLVFGATNLAKLLNLSPYFISLTVIGVGATIPDFAIELRALLREHQAIGVGDILGSLAIELVLYFGIVAIFHPLSVDIKSVFNAGIFLVLCTTLLLYFVKKKFMSWKNGVLLTGLYFTFLLIEWLSGH